MKTCNQTERNLANRFPVLINFTILGTFSSSLLSYCTEPGVLGNILDYQLMIEIPCIGTFILGIIICAPEDSPV